MGISQDARTGTLIISVSNRQKPMTVRYGRKISDWVAFRLELAMAHNRALLPAFIGQLEQGLSEIDARKPAPPAGGQPSPLSGKQEARAHTNSHVVASRRSVGGVQGEPGAKNAGPYWRS